MGGRPYLLLQVEAFVHTQVVPMDVVVIQHNKGKLYPLVTLVRYDGIPIEALVESVDKHSVVVKLNRAVEFTAYIY